MSRAALQRSKPHGLCLVLALLLAVLTPGLVRASAITPLDTFPTSGEAFGPGYSVFGFFEWQEIAVPFHLAAPGTITEIETGFFIGSGQFQLGIAAGPLVGQTHSQVDSLFSTSACSGSEVLNCELVNPDMIVPTGELLSFDPALSMAAGDYWLYIRAVDDNDFGGWYSNASLLTDTWAVNNSSLPGFPNYSAVSWSLVADHGPGISGSPSPGGLYATPAARISYEPGLRVPEPSTTALFCLGIAGLVMSRRRKQSIARNPGPSPRSPVRCRAADR